MSPRAGRRAVACSRALLAVGGAASILVVVAGLLEFVPSSESGSDGESSSNGRLLSLRGHVRRNMRRALQAPLATLADDELDRFFTATRESTLARRRARRNITSSITKAASEIEASVAFYTAESNRRSSLAKALRANSVPKSTYEGHIRPGWCRHWHQGSSKGRGRGLSYWNRWIDPSIDMDSCFQRCVEDPVCEQAVFETPESRWGAQCLIGTNTMPVEPSSSRDCSPGVCVDYCFAKAAWPVPPASPAPPSAPPLSPHDGRLSAGTHTIRRAGAWELLLVVKAERAELPASLQWPVPCARSYGENEWEVLRPRDLLPSAMVHVEECTSTSCQVVIPDDDAFAYVLREDDQSLERYRSLVARGFGDVTAAHFLIQATFGPTRSELNQLRQDLDSATGKGAIKEWLLNQMAEPPTLHRAYLRRRSNPRLDAVTEVGRPRGACEPNSRWNSIAIRGDDMEQTLIFHVISEAGGITAAMHVGGVLRSEVTLSDVRPLGTGAPEQGWQGQHGELVMGKEYVICSVEEWRMGTVVIGSECTGKMYPQAENRVEIYNVPMSFEHLQYPTVDRFGEAIESWEMRDGDAAVHGLNRTIYNEAALLVSQLRVACPFSLGAQVRPSTTLKTPDGRYYRYDPRLVTMENDIDSPARTSSTTLSHQGRTCPLKDPSAPKTMFNEHSCIISHGCQPDQFSATPFQLNTTTIRQFYLAGNSFVYAVDSLPMNGASNPCYRLARWRAQASCAAVTSLPSATEAVLADAIRSSTDRNPFVKDVELDRAARSSCSGSVVGATIDVGGKCWQHVHDDELNVYDFTLWSMDASCAGTDEKRGFYPVKLVAIQGDVVLHYPEPCSWNAGFDRHLRGPALGRFGDWVEFKQLPVGVQSTGFAQAMGVDVTPSESLALSEMCGSAGEVSADPGLDAQLYFGKERYYHPPQFSQQEYLENYRGEGDRKQTIHSTISIFATDQLRQRVAWSLSQIVVIGDAGSVVLGDHTEVWTTFYDILVRHAFGSYRDILREVSFSPLMAHYLTYMDSASYAYKATVADENYARELMQLFSVGLFILNRDGTQLLDAVGKPMPTYTNDDIVEQARVWTGFRRRGIRGNLEQSRISQNNQVDPMELHAERRDAFPKRNLYLHHIGDGYPLCTDLPSQPFLRTGAKYRFLGPTGVPDLMNGGEWDFGDAPPREQPLFEPDPHESALYAALCNSGGTDGACRFQSSIVLNSNLPCSGEECELSTLRVVKIRTAGTNVFFEYEPAACISLAFLDGASGVFIENINSFRLGDDALVERLCADPKAPVAEAGCCSPRGSSCFESTCHFVEERVPLQNALQQCDKLWPPGMLSPPSPPSATEVAEWFLHPAEYRTAVSECPEGSRGPEQDECLGAATEALAAAGEPHFDTPAAWSVRNGAYRISNANAPSGCIVNTNDRKVYYNTRIDGENKGDYKLVCDSSSGAADFRTASPRLCSRKRKVCWWRNPEDVPPNCRTGYNNGGTYYSQNPYYWSEVPCTVQAQVHRDGRVSIVHPGGKSIRRTEVNSDNWFFVRWHDGNFPKADSNCAGACAIVRGDEGGSTCVCDIAVSTRACFESPPSRAEVEGQLFIGAPPPSHFDNGMYTLCQTAACNEHFPGVKMHTRGTASAPIFDENAIFEIVINQTAPTNGRTLFLANKQSDVTISNMDPSTAFSFRNPPQMMTLVDPTQRDAIYETNALLDHLFYHENLAPFIAYRLIQRLVTSNPSPRYVSAATTAFRTGTFGDTTFTGQYGDLGATVAAILLDREARSLVLTADPTHGHMREPLIKMFHIMRSMEYTPREFRAVQLRNGLCSMTSTIGQGVFGSPTVFSFFLPEYTPEGAALSAKQVVPEAQIGALPFVLGFMDATSSLFFDGLSSCRRGYGAGLCDGDTYPAEWTSPIVNHGFLRFSPENAATTIEELDLLLTAGRLDNYSKTIITEEYTYALHETSCPVDRSADFCGRLVPGQELQPGERLVNARGELLCQTKDGVARHIGVDGKEVFATVKTRGGRSPLRYEPSGRLGVAGPISYGSGTHAWKWDSQRYEQGSYAAFHTFLAGPCQLQSESVYEGSTKYHMSSYLAVTQTITCTAVDTCSLSPAAPPSPDVLRERAKTEADYALKVAQDLISVSAAFSTTNEPAIGSTAAEDPPPRESLDRPYKALVILYMAGGANTFNMLVPLAQCDARNLAQQYVSTRGPAGLPLTELLPISVTPATQPCDTMGLHPELATLQQLWNDGDLAFQANVGALVEPMSATQYFDKARKEPNGLFAHNLQTTGAQTLNPQSTTGEIGVCGRLLEALERQAVERGEVPLKATAYSISPSDQIFRGAPVGATMLSAKDGIVTYAGTETAAQANNGAERSRFLAAVEKLTGKVASSIFAETHNQQVRTSLKVSRQVSSTMSDDDTLTQNWAAANRYPSSGNLAGQLEQVSRVIAARRAFRAERDIFYVELPGMDHHTKGESSLQDKFRDLNAVLNTFVAEMKGLGVWERVTLQSLSEFGRTMTSNGQGTDHAWGGNHFTIGGSVRGGTIHGQYPEVRIDGPNSVSSTGVMLPTSPWESIWKPLALWLGVREDQLGHVMPNLHAFPDSSLPTDSDYFTS